MELFGGMESLDLAATYNAAAAANSDPEFSTARSVDTVTSNAIDSTTPMQSGAGSMFAGLWSDIGKPLLAHWMVKDMAQTQADNASAGQPGQAQPLPAQPTTGGMGPVLIVGVLALLAGVLIVKADK